MMIKENIQKQRNSFLQGFTVEENEKAQVVIGRKDTAGKFFTMIFEGRSGKPKFYYRFRSKEGRERYLSKYIEQRTQFLHKKEEEKKKRSAKKSR